MRGRGGAWALAGVLAGVLAGCETEGGVSSTACEVPCYGGPAGTLGVGACHAGKPLCADGRVVGCEGDLGPTRELCDGVDNDCDGRVDESPVEAGLTCASGLTRGRELGGASVCRPGVQVCFNGHVECVGEVGPAEEACNGLDDDCNGRVDDLPMRTCYSRDVSELVVPRSACRAGVELCSGGRLLCFGEAGPTEELCDSLDNDCDGKVDDGVVGPPSSVDVMLLVDTSGSMATRMPQVRAALVAALSRFSTAEYRYGLLLVPALLTETIDFAHALDRASVLVPYVDQLHIGSGSLEDSLDAAAGCVDGTFAVGWRPSARRLVLWFGDEAAQTSRGLTELDVAGRLFAAGAVFHGFVNSSAEYRRGYDDLARLTGGALHDLDVPAAELEALLVEAIESPCAP